MLADSAYMQLHNQVAGTVHLRSVWSWKSRGQDGIRPQGWIRMTCGTDTGRSSGGQAEEGGRSDISSYNK